MAFNWEPDYTRPPQPREVIFIGGAADGAHRVVEHARPWLEVMVFKGMQPLTVPAYPSKITNVVNTDEIYSREVYERQELSCGDERDKPGDPEKRPFLVYVLQGMPMREAFKRLLDGYAPRRNPERMIVR